MNQHLPFPPGAGGRPRIVVSRGQSQNPAKRALEESIASAAAAALPGVEVLLAPHLYDVPASHDIWDRLRAGAGELVVLAWGFPRALHWTLDRHGVRGRLGETPLAPVAEDEELDDDLDEDAVEEEGDERRRVADERPAEPRTITCLDLRWSEEPAVFVDELRRIVESSRERADAAGNAVAARGSDAERGRPTDLLSWLGGTPSPEQLDRYLAGPGSDGALDAGAAPIMRLDAEGGRRWYPVIDYSRCTNCMECIDFCLFGVYGVDRTETILVEQPDNCRKGCPACSRVCPEQAIIFPQHKSPEIAGAEGGAGSLKIDLSLLFGGGGDAAELAARERDEQLLLAGRDAVGMTVGASRPTSAPDVATPPVASPAAAAPAAASQAAASQPAAESPAKDELDQLLDKLDELDV